MHRNCLGGTDNRLDKNRYYTKIKTARIGVRRAELNTQLKRRVRIMSPDSWLEKKAPNIGHIAETTG